MIYETTTINSFGEIKLQNIFNIAKNAIVFVTLNKK